MKVVIPGGSGQVGALLSRALVRAGDEVVILSRGPADVPAQPATAPTPGRGGVEPRIVHWNGESLGSWCRELEGADAVINLAGRSVNCRYNPENRDRIKQSRVRTTRLIGEALARVEQPPALWLQASTATLYAHRYDAPNDEATGIVGGQEPGLPNTWRFSIDVAKAWERALDEVDAPGTRKVKMRSAMIMSPDRGGIFETLLGLVRLGLGGRAGDGKQYVSWIHEADFVRAVRWIMERETLAGAINLASPHPLPQADFMRILRQAWGMPIGLPATRWMLEIGALFMRTETELILKSRRVIPGRLDASGFRFDFPEWQEAAEDLCRRWREERSKKP